MAQYFKDKLKEKEKRDKDPKKNKLQTDLSWVTLVNNLIKQSGIFQGCILLHRFWKPSHCRFENVKSLPESAKSYFLLSISFFLPTIPLFIVICLFFFLFSTFSYFLLFSPPFLLFFPFSLFFSSFPLLFPSFSPLFPSFPLLFPSFSPFFFPSFLPFWKLPNLFVPRGGDTELYTTLVIFLTNLKHTVSGLL